MHDLDPARGKRREQIALYPGLHAFAKPARAAADIEQRRQLPRRVGGEPVADPARLAFEHRCRRLPPATPGASGGRAPCYGNTISTRRFCGSRTPSAVGTSGCRSRRGR